MKLVFIALAVLLAVQWFARYPTDEAAVRTAITSSALAIFYFIGRAALWLVMQLRRLKRGRSR